MPEYSGAGYRAHNLYKRLTAVNPDIRMTVVCGSETENDCMKYVYGGVDVNRIACKQYPVLDSGIVRRWGNLCNFHSEYSETRKFLASLPAKPDLVHVFGQNYVTSTAIDHAIRNKIPLIIELVTDLESPFQYVPFPFKYFLKTKPSDNFIFVCISEKLKTMCLSNGIVPENIWCRPNPVDEKKFRPVSAEVKCELRRKLTKFTGSDKLISYIAKYRPSKNQKFLVEVMKHLPGEFKLFMKGPLVNDGPLAGRDNAYFNETRDMVARQNLAGRIQVEEGFCENVGEYYQMSDAYAFPSESEGLGTPILESVASGIPVVANRIRGVTDVWIKDANNGYLSDLEPARFADKIILASELPAGKRQLESENILKVAGTENIDMIYADLIYKRLKKQ
ncbi:MAG: glycosyltransferase family 4 protein [Lentisphaerae bacterium]|nr:glycosyltransferase family 4 protein [Lentisphaerota bacterium]